MKQEILKNSLPNNWSQAINIFQLVTAFQKVTRRQDIPSKNFPEREQWGCSFSNYLCVLASKWSQLAASLMSSGISSSFSSFKMRAWSHSVSFPQPIWRFQQGFHQLQMPCCFSSAWWLSSPHKELEGFWDCHWLEVWDGVENTPTDKIISTQDLECSLQCVLTFSLSLSSFQVPLSSWKLWHSFSGIQPNPCGGWIDFAMTSHHLPCVLRAPSISILT